MTSPVNVKILISPIDIKDNTTNILQYLKEIKGNVSEDISIDKCQIEPISNGSLILFRGVAKAKKIETFLTYDSENEFFQRKNTEKVHYQWFYIFIYAHNNGDASLFWFFPTSISSETMNRIINSTTRVLSKVFKNIHRPLSLPSNPYTLAELITTYNRRYGGLAERTSVRPKREYEEIIRGNVKLGLREKSEEMRKEFKPKVWELTTTHYIQYLRISARGDIKIAFVLRNKFFNDFLNVGKEERIKKRAIQKILVDLETVYRIYEFILTKHITGDSTKIIDFYLI